MRRLGRKKTRKLLRISDVQKSALVGKSHFYSLVEGRSFSSQSYTDSGVHSIRDCLTGWGEEHNKAKVRQLLARLTDSTAAPKDESVLFSMTAISNNQPSTSLQNQLQGITVNPSKARFWHMPQDVSAPTVY